MQFKIVFIVLCIGLAVNCGSTFFFQVRQAKSKQKIIDKMEAAGLIEKVWIHLLDKL